QAMSAEITKLLHVWVQLGNLQLDRLLVDGDEAHSLVRRSLHEELHLTVLIGSAERREWCWTNARVSFHAVLAEALCPELDEPVGDIAQRIGVRHEDMDVPPQLRVRQKLQHREGASGILGERIRLTTPRDLFRAGK